MTERSEKWFRMQDEDGFNILVAPATVKERLGIEDIKRFLEWNQRRIEGLEVRIEVLEEAPRRAKIIEALRGQGWHNATWIRNRTKARSTDLEALVDQGKIQAIDRGFHTMYAVD